MQEKVNQFMACGLGLMLTVSSNNAMGKPIDKFMAAGSELAGKEHYISADDSRLRLNGFYWRKPGEPFRRMPEDPQLPKAVNILSAHTSGGVLRFRSNTSLIKIRAKIRVRNNTADIMTYGRIGFDLYVDGIFRGISRLNFDKVNSLEYTYVSTLQQTGDGAMHDYKLYFPLYAEVLDFGIAFTPGSVFEPPAPFADERPVVLYGTSIEQGCCASRPGLSLGNQISRKLNLPVLNFGFSGSGHGESVVAEQLANIENPCVYVLSYDANVSPENLEKTLRPFVEILKKAHPETPIISVSHLLCPRQNPESEWHARRTAAHQKAGTVFLNGLTVLGPDYDDCYIDTIHPNDLGMKRFADALAEKIKEFVSIPGTR